MGVKFLAGLGISDGAKGMMFVIEVLNREVLYYK